jgi:hypothetical protein
MKIFILAVLSGVFMFVVVPAGVLSMAVRFFVWIGVVVWVAIYSAWDDRTPDLSCMDESESTDGEKHGIK